MSKSLEDLYYENLAVGHEKQKKLIALLEKENTYSVDFKTAQITFESGASFNFVVLASESFAENSWLWGWANQDLTFNEQELRRRDEFKEIGEKNGIESLIQPMLQLGDGWSACDLALISLGITNFAGYYRYPHEHGAFYLLLEANELISLQVSVDLHEINSIFTDCWSLYDDGSHSDILKFYLKHKGVPYSIRGTELVAEFNAQKLTCELSPSGHASKSVVTM